MLNRAVKRSAMAALLVGFGMTGVTWAADQQVFLDPVTGKPRAPSEQERETIAPVIAVEPKIELQPQEFRASNGARGVRLGPAQHQHLSVRLDADGKAHSRCDHGGDVAR